MTNTEQFTTVTYNIVAGAIWKTGAPMPLSMALNRAKAHNYNFRLVNTPMRSVVVPVAAVIRGAVYGE